MSGLEVRHFRRFVVRPTLEHLGLYSDAAETLVIGTAAHESGFRYLDQITAGSEELGPAYELFQIEPATHDDLFANFLRYSRPLRDRLVALRAMAPSAHQQLVSNLAYACGVCRLLYYRHPEPLPMASDLAGIADYWKRYYNTHAGRGRPEQWLEAYLRLVEE